ncbi:MAG: nucleoside kinase [Bacteroidaceae bacterium]|nr:nucleoside kinase [Bacteroidaceae bacterium]
MANTINIRCKNTGKTFPMPLGCSVKDVYEQAGVTLNHGPVCASINNKVQGLNYRFYNSKDVELLDLTTVSGKRTYVHTLFFVLAKAVEDIFPDGRLIIGAPVCRGYYCELYIGRPIETEDVRRIRQRMQEIIETDMQIHRIQCPIEEAIQIFRQRGMESKAQLLESQGNLYAYYYQLDETIDFFYGCLLTHTSQIHLFDLMPLDEGMLLRVPSRKNPSELEPIEPQEKKLGVFREYHRWQHIMGVRNAGDVNASIKKGMASELINIAEALQERKLHKITDEIVERGSKLVLIAGPSSSGKTTTSKRIAIQLMACGLHPHTLSTDNYFVNRVDTPLDEHGEYDFECIEAVDTAFFNQQMNQLLNGEEVELPRYDFPSGERKFEGKKLKIGSDDVIILEGNHALNPILSRQIPEDKKYRIYVSTLTTIALDDHNYVPTEDIRLLRRLLRDFRYRGYTALETIRRYPSVSRGEEKWIFPFQETADATFNSALLYELNVIREQVMPILEQVSEREPEYSEASRLRKFLRYFLPVPARQVPPTSLLREFSGGSSFKY